MVRRTFVVLAIIVASLVSLYYINLLGAWLDTTPHEFGIGVEGSINRSIIYVCHTIYGLIFCVLLCVIIWVLCWFSKGVFEGIVMLCRFVGGYIKFGVKRKN